MIEQLYHSSIEQAFHVTWYWFFVVSFILFQVGFIWRWVQTHDVSSGHTIVGGSAVLSCLTLLLVVIWASAYAYFFAPFAMLTTAGWLLYNDWYFHNYKNYAAIIADPKNGPNTFGMKTRLAKLLIEKPSGASFWTADRVKWTMIFGVPVLLALFGFVERLNSIAEGDKRVAAVLNSTKKQSLANRDSVTSAVKTAVQDVIDTVRKGQGRILAKADSANRNATAAKLFSQKTDDKVNRLGKKTDQTNRLAERTFRGTIYVPSTPTLRPPQFRLPAVVVPAPVKAEPIQARPLRGTGKGKNQAYNVNDTDSTYRDSTYYARYNN